MNDVRWETQRPAPTITTTRRSDRGLLVGRQLPEGEGRNVGGHGYEREPCGDPLNLKGDDWPDRRPATTLAGDPRVFQPGGHHGEGEQSANAVRVTIEEASTLQGFPPDHPWQGSPTKRFEQVGNAVPPPLARAILGALIPADLEQAA